MAGRLAKPCVSESATLERGTSMIDEEIFARLSRRIDSYRNDMIELQKF
jgi:hypothetical protein